MAGGGSGDQPEEAVSETGSQVRGDLFAFSVPNFAAFFGRSFFHLFLCERSGVDCLDTPFSF